MFHGWDSFYLLIGGASGALIGLLFVVETLTAGYERDKALAGASVYVTPILFHFAAALVVSAVALTPGLSVAAAAGLVGLCAVAGLGYSIHVSVRLRLGRIPEPAHWSDFWFYGCAPSAGYLALGAAAAGAAASPAKGPYAIAAATLAILLIAVRNAWDLVTWLAPGANRS